MYLTTCGVYKLYFRLLLWKVQGFIQNIINITLVCLLNFATHIGLVQTISIPVSTYLLHHSFILPLNNKDRKFYQHVYL